MKSNNELGKMRQIWNVIATAILILFVGYVAFILPNSQALAVGDSNLDSLIITNPYPSLSPEAPTQLTSIVNAIKAIEKPIVSGPINVAAEGWENISNGSKLLVYLMALSIDLPNPQAQANGEVLGACNSLDGGSSSSPLDIAGIPFSAETTCTSNTNPSFTLEGISFVRGNVLVALDFFNPSNLQSPSPEQVANSQFSLIPAGGIPISSGSSFTIVLIISIVIVLLAVLIFVTFYLRHQKLSRLNYLPPSLGYPQTGYGYGQPSYYSQQSMPMQQNPYQYPMYGRAQPTTDPLSAPINSVQTNWNSPANTYPGSPIVSQPATEVGWHVVEGNPHKQRYFDGNQWTSTIIWNGQDWVNEPPNSTYSGL